MIPARPTPCHPRRVRRPVPSTLRAVATALALSVASWGAAHATMVFVTVDTAPTPPLANDATTIRIAMRDTVDAPVEDAIVFVEATRVGHDMLTSDRFVETDAGTYETTVRFPDEGDWTLTFRDRTFRQEEANATITLDVGADATRAPPSFIFPPTATGPQSLTTWLVWLIGLPLVAGAIVTVMVLRGRGGDGPEGAPPDATGG